MDHPDPNSQVLGILAIGLDRVTCHFRLAFPQHHTNSHFSSISLSHHHYLLPHTHTLSLSISISPSPLSFVTHLFTLMLQWTLPIASQVPHSPLVPRPHVPTTRLPFIPHHLPIILPTPSSLCMHCQRSQHNLAPLHHSCLTTLRFVLFCFHTPSGLVPSCSLLDFSLFYTSYFYLLNSVISTSSLHSNSSILAKYRALMCRCCPFFSVNLVCVWPKQGHLKLNFACCHCLCWHSFLFSSLLLILPSPLLLSPFPLGVGTHSTYELTWTP